MGISILLLPPNLSPKIFIKITCLGRLNFHHSCLLSSKFLFIFQPNEVIYYQNANSGQLLVALGSPLWHILGIVCELDPSEGKFS